ncbi:hypothetical protein C8R47DRAFT_1106895 [Mycena vitilis]|nr:hypothetical protein C8R47DRAFT_1106895 [Mycena vitilis]
MFALLLFIALGTLLTGTSAGATLTHISASVEGSSTVFFLLAAPTTVIETVIFNSLSEIAFPCPTSGPKACSGSITALASRVTLTSVLTTAAKTTSTAVIPCPSLASCAGPSATQIRIDHITVSAPPADLFTASSALPSSTSSLTSARSSSEPTSPNLPVVTGVASTKKSSKKTQAVVGGILGTLCILGIGVALFLMFRRRRLQGTQRFFRFDAEAAPRLVVREWTNRFLQFRSRFRGNTEAAARPGAQESQPQSQILATDGEANPPQNQPRNAIPCLPVLPVPSVSVGDSGELGEKRTLHHAELEQVQRLQDNIPQQPEEAAPPLMNAPATDGAADTESTPSAELAILRARVLQLENERNVLLWAGDGEAPPEYNEREQDE